MQKTATRMTPKTTTTTMSTVCVDEFESGTRSSTVAAGISGNGASVVEVPLTTSTSFCAATSLMSESKS